MTLPLPYLGFRAVGMPRNVRRFEFLSYLAGIIFLTTLVFDDMLAPTMLEFIGNVIWCLFIVFLIWSAARRRRNWARFTLLGLFIVEIIELTFITGAYYHWSVFLVSLRLSITGIQGLALCFVFSGDSRPWFRSRMNRVASDGINPSPTE